MLLLTEEDVDSLLPMKDAVREVEAALRAMGEGRATIRPRQRLRTPAGVLNLMAGAWPDRGYYGFKYYVVSRAGVRFWVHLFDVRTGELLAVMQADRLGQRRTGAASGVATKHLARRDASVIGLLGTGWQAESQLEALCAVRPIHAVRCYSRHAANRRSFATRMMKALGVEVRAVDSARAAIRQADVIATATTSKDPVLRAEWIQRGVHLNAMGANRADAREVGEDVIGRSDLIVADSIEQARIEAGDLILPASRGLLRWEWIHELGEVVAGRVRGRTSGQDLTLFKSLGIALEDVAVAAHVYERAKKHGIGSEVAL